VTTVFKHHSQMSSLNSEMESCFVHYSVCYGSCAFSVAAPNIWNKLPADVLTANSLPVFCRRLKTHLFTAAFGDN